MKMVRRLFACSLVLCFFIRFNRTDVRCEYNLACRNQSFYPSECSTTGLTPMRTFGPQGTRNYHENARRAVLNELNDGGALQSTRRSFREIRRCFFFFLNERRS